MGIIGKLKSLIQKTQIGTHYGYRPIGGGSSTEGVPVYDISKGTATVGGRGGGGGAVSPTSRTVTQAQLRQQREYQRQTQAKEKGIKEAQQQIQTEVLRLQEQQRTQQALRNVTRQERIQQRQEIQNIQEEGRGRIEKLKNIPIEKFVPVVEDLGTGIILKPSEKRKIDTKETYDPKSGMYVSGDRGTLEMRPPTPDEREKIDLVQERGSFAGITGAVTGVIVEKAKKIQESKPVQYTRDIPIIKKLREKNVELTEKYFGGTWTEEERIQALAEEKKKTYKELFFAGAIPSIIRKGSEDIFGTYTKKVGEITTKIFGLEPFTATQKEELKKIGGEVGLWSAFSPIFMTGAVTKLKVKGKGRFELLAEHYKGIETYEGKLLSKQVGKVIKDTTTQEKLEVLRKALMGTTDKKKVIELTKNILGEEKTISLVKELLAQEGVTGITKVTPTTD